jgi:hypothetical protein
VIRLDVKQGSAEWHLARLGIPTASQFDRILTKKKRELAAGAEKYMHELLAEWLIGMPAGAEARGFMERGTNLESWAVGYYELQNDVDTEAVGFVLRDDRKVGCSPDRLVGDKGGLEIKVPSAQVHVANLLNMTDDHFAQAQGCMWVCDREWWDLLSYHPDLPPAIVRIERDKQYIADLDRAMREFLPTLEDARKRLLDLGCVPAQALAPEFLTSLATESVLPDLG